MQTSSSLAWFLIPALLVGGATLGVQAPTNAMIGRASGSPVFGALVSFAVGTVVLAIAVVALRVKPDWGATMALPWYAWLGGFYGAFFVSLATFAAPRLGVGATLTLLIAGQVICGLLLDHFGAFGLPRQPFTWVRAVGVAAVIGGAFLVRR